MAVVISGTSGISGTNGSAGTPAVQGEDTNTGIFFPAADTVAVATGGAERVRVDNSGNLGIGVTSVPSYTNYKGIAVGGVVGGTIDFMASNIGAGQNRAAQIFSVSSGLGFATGASDAIVERARIDSSGNLLVGATTAPTFPGSSHLAVKGGLGFLGGSASTYYYTIQSNTSDFYIGSPTLTRYAALFSINSFTAWSFGSDRRIKDNIEDLDYGLEAVLSMRPRQYTLKDNDQFSIGFVAQELKDVVPEAVTGEEVPFEDSDTPQERASKTMGVSKETLIPILVKAIQELTARVAQLEAQ